MVADRQIVDPVAEGVDHAGGLMTQRHGKRANPVSVYHGQVGVTKAGGLDADADLAGTGVVQLEIL
jgi:hypothetical protein